MLSEQFEDAKVRFMKKAFNGTLSSLALTLALVQGCGTDSPGTEANAASQTDTHTLDAHAPLSDATGDASAGNEEPDVMDVSKRSKRSRPMVVASH